MPRLKVYDLATGTWKYAGGVDPVALATDGAFTSRYPTIVNHGAIASTARVGTAPNFWIGSVDPTNAVNNDELFRTDQTAKYVRVAGAWVEIGSTRYAPIATPWIPFSYATGWSAYGATVFEVPGYRKIGDNVQLRGLVTAGVGVTTLFTTLPAGFRPSSSPNSLDVLTACYISSGVMSRVDIASTGVMTIASAANGVWASMSSIPQFTTLP
jgi:hypothetical protein